MWTNLSPPFRNFLGFALGVLFVALCAVAMEAKSVERTYGYELSTTNCVGETVDLSYYDQLELYVDVTPIAASGVSCPDDPGFTPDVPPSAVNTVAIGTAELSLTGGTVSIELLSGLTYHARARVRNTDGTWSQLSNEVTVTIPAGAPQMPTLFIISQREDGRIVLERKLPA